METKLPKRILLLVLFLTVILSGCSSSGSEQTQTPPDLKQQAPEQKPPKQEAEWNREANPEETGAISLSAAARSYSPEYTEDDEKSLSSGNFIVKFDRFVVYSSPERGRIYRHDLLAHTTTKLSDDQPRGLYFDGRNIVYSLDGFINGPKGIYRLTLDGNREKISDDYTQKLALYHDQVYYIKQIGDDEINHTAQGELYRIDLDGRNKVKLLPDKIKHHFVIKDDWIYYTRLDNRALYKARLDGTEETRLAAGRTFILLATDKNLYYSDYNDGEAIHKVSLDGAKNESLGRWGTVHESDGQVYVQTRVGNREQVEMFFSLWSVDEEKDEKIRLLTMPDIGIDRFFSVKDGWIYMQDGPEGAYRINLNNYTKEKMAVPPYAGVYVYGDYVYFFDELKDIKADYGFHRIAL